MFEVKTLPKCVPEDNSSSPSRVLARTAEVLVLVMIRLGANPKWDYERERVLHVRSTTGQHECKHADNAMFLAAGKQSDSCQIPAMDHQLSIVFFGPPVSQATWLGAQTASTWDCDLRLFSV